MNSQTTGCGHCRNLKKSDWTGHNVGRCPVLAATTCPSCRKNGHTSGYCKEKKKVDEYVPVATGWASIAKKAITPKDKAQNDALDANIKATQEEKKKKEHEAYLKRKALRESRAFIKKEQDEKNWKLWSTHMYYVYGRKWYCNFESYLIYGNSLANEIPEPFCERVQKMIDDDYLAVEHTQMRADKRYAEEEASKKALKKVMKAKLSPIEYQKWKEEQSQREDDDTDEWLDAGWCHMITWPSLLSLRPF